MMFRHVKAKYRIRLAILSSILVIVGIGYGIFIYQPAKELDARNHIVPPAGEIEIRGQMLCLPHKDRSGIQTLECAFGVQDEQGRLYALRDTDSMYKNVSRVPSGTKIIVNGTFTPGNGGKYQEIGTIAVTRIVQIEK